MHDAGKILTTLIVFFGLLSFPAWYNAASGTTANPLEIENPKKENPGKKCVMEREYMRANHMDLLNNWRDEVVRKADFKHKAPDGTVYEKSLTKTCLGCHTKTAFCDKCHEYSGMETIYCWDCHADPKEKK